MRNKDCCEHSFRRPLLGSVHPSAFSLLNFFFRTLLSSSNQLIKVLSPPSSQSVHHCLRERQTFNAKNIEKRIRIHVILKHSPCHHGHPSLLFMGKSRFTFLFFSTEVYMSKFMGLCSARGTFAYCPYRQATAPHETRLSRALQRHSNVTTT